MSWGDLQRLHRVQARMHIYRWNPPRHNEHQKAQFPDTLLDRKADPKRKPWTDEERENIPLPCALDIFYKLQRRADCAKVLGSARRHSRPRDQAESLRGTLRTRGPTRRCKG